MQGDDDSPATYASPPCFMHEVDPVYLGLPEAADFQTCKDVERWRKSERKRLIDERLAVPAGVRSRHGEAIAAGVLAEIGSVRGLIVSAYWPFRGEPDLRPLQQQVAEGGGRMALPVVVEKGRPLEFHLWQQGGALARGIWNIPVPAERAPCRPDVVIAPVVGYDADCYRLGYGGGYFDRTLAVLPKKPRVIGVGFRQARLPTIYPLPHDVPMDAVVTETGIVRPAARVL